ncbi:MAG: MFS transporter [Proteobacteria bacterium]|nr:MFS transporter [Pseudomonadota bacterium]
MSNFPSSNPSKNLLAALMCGNMLEYFDFFIFAHFTFLLAPKFYPPINPLFDSIVAGFFFAIGFLARPIGGYFFGRLADYSGRRRSLMFSVLGMAIPTLCIGLLPTYTEVGIVAPIALIICRIIQGLCMGGEFTNGGVLLIESYGWKRAGTVAGFYNFSSGMGSLLAIACVAVVSSPGMPEWSWRVPFFIASFLGVVAYYLRSYVGESPVFEREAQINQASDLKLLSGKYRRYFIRAFFTGAVAGVFIWIPLSFTSFYMTKILFIPLHTAVKMTVLAVILHSLFTCIFGWLSDRVGWKKMMLAGCITQMTLLYPAFTLLYDQQFVMFQILTVIPAAMAYSVVHPLSSFQVPALLRGRLSGFSFSAGMCIFAGLTPVITGTLTQLMNGSLLGVAAYLLSISVVGGLVIYRLFQEKTTLEKIEYRMVA